MAALFMPALMAATGLVLPMRAGAGDEGWARALDLVGSWTVRLVLLGVIALSFFHCAHRIRHILMDLGLRHAGPVLSVVCYGGAMAGGAAAGWVLATL